MLLSRDRCAARESEAKLSGQSKGEPLATLSGPQMRPEAGSGEGGLAESQALANRVGHWAALVWHMA